MWLFSMDGEKVFGSIWASADTALVICNTHPNLILERLDEEK
jgi:hypothetical protein